MSRPMREAIIPWRKTPLTTQAVRALHTVRSCSLSIHRLLVRFDCLLRRKAQTLSRTTKRFSSTAASRSSSANTHAQSSKRQQWWQHGRHLTQRSHKTLSGQLVITHSHVVCISSTPVTPRCALAFYSLCTGHAMKAFFAIKAIIT